MGWVTPRQEAVAAVCQWQMISKMSISRDTILATAKHDGVTGNVLATLGIKIYR